MADHQFIDRRTLTKVDGTIDVITVRSAATAIRLNNKRTQVMSLYNKSKLFDETSEVYLNVLNMAEEVAYDADITKIVMAVKSWELPAEAFVVELEDLGINKLNVELLREDVFVEIVGFINDIWDPSPTMTPEEKEEDTKNEIEPSIS